MATPRYINTPVSDGGATQRSIEDSFNRFLAQRQQTQNFRQQLMAEERAAAQRALAEAKAEARRMDDRRYAEEREAERRDYALRLREEEREFQKGLREEERQREDEKEENRRAYQKDISDLARAEAAKAAYVRAGGSVDDLIEKMKLDNLSVDELRDKDGNIDDNILRINEETFKIVKAEAEGQKIDQVKSVLVEMGVEDSQMLRGEGESDEQYRNSLLRLVHSTKIARGEEAVEREFNLKQKQLALTLMPEEEYQKILNEGGTFGVNKRIEEISGQKVKDNALAADRFTEFAQYKESARRLGLQISEEDFEKVGKNLTDDKIYSDFRNKVLEGRVASERAVYEKRKAQTFIEIEGLIDTEEQAKSKNILSVYKMLQNPDMRNDALKRGLITQKMADSIANDSNPAARAKSVVDRAVAISGKTDALMTWANATRTANMNQSGEGADISITSILGLKRLTDLDNKLSTIESNFTKFLNTPVPGDILRTPYSQFDGKGVSLSPSQGGASVPVQPLGTGQTPAASGSGGNLPLPTGASQGGGGDVKLPMLEPEEVAQAPADQIADSGMTVEQSRALDELGVDWRNSRVPGVQLMLDQIEKLGSDVDLANKELGELKQQLFYGVKVTPGLALASGLADSQYDLSPAEKSDLRKRISSAESSISQKLSSIERLKRLTGTSTPETPAIPLTPIAKAEQSAQRGLLRKLEQTQTLARVKRQEGEQLRASSRAAAAAGKLETAERLRSEGDAILVEAKVIEQEALEIEKQLEGTSPVPQENKDLIESKRNFPSLPANPPELQVNRMENLPSGSAYSQFAEDMVDNAMYAPQAALNTDPMNLQGLAPENLPASGAETLENTAPTLLGTEMPPASSLRPPAYPPEPTPMPPASDLRPPAYNEAPPPVVEYQAPLTAEERLRQKLDAARQGLSRVRSSIEDSVERLTGRSLPMAQPPAQPDLTMAPGVPAPSRPQVASQNIPQVPVMPPDYPVRRGADVMAPAVPKPVNPNVAPVGLPVRRGADIMAPAVPKPVNPNVAPTGLPVRRGADVMAPAVPKPMNPNVAGEEPLVTLPMPSGPSDDMALLEEAGVLLDGSRNIVDAIKDRLVEVSAYGTREDVAYIPVLQELLEKAINKTLAVDPDKVPTVEPMPEESIPPLPGLPR